MILPLLAVYGCAALVSGNDQAEAYRSIREIYSDQLADFAGSLEGGKGSLQADIRAKAVALGRKFHSSNPALSKVGRNPTAAMTDAQKEADGALRKELAEREKQREEAEKSAPDAPFPDPANIAEEFDAMRWEMASEMVSMAEGLSVNPLRREEVALRKKILADADSILGRPRWACERALEKRIDELKAEKYIPWAGSWQTDWGTIELNQGGTTVTGKWDGGRLSGRFNLQKMVLAGRWQASGVAGAFEFTLSEDEESFAASVTQGREKKSWKGTKVVEESK